MGLTDSKTLRASAGALAGSPLGFLPDGKL